MEGTIVAMHSLGFMIRPDDGSPDVYYECHEPTEVGWHKRQRVMFTLADAVVGESLRRAAMVRLIPHPAPEH